MADRKSRTGKPKNRFDPFPGKLPHIAWTQAA